MIDQASSTAPSGQRLSARAIQGYGGAKRSRWAKASQAVVSGDDEGVAEAATLAAAPPSPASSINVIVEQAAAQCEPALSASATKPTFTQPKQAQAKSSTPGFSAWWTRAPKVVAEPVAPLEPLRGAMQVVDELLRDRGALLARIERGQQLQLIAKAMLMVLGASSASVGVVLGMYRGGLQVLFAGIKLPLVVLATVAVCAPLYTALKRSLGHRSSLAKDLAMCLSALALMSLVSASLAPLLLWAILDGASYHKLILGTVGIGAMGGLAGYVLFFRGMSGQIQRGHRLIATTLLIVMGLVGVQLSWVMRPYLVRPQTVETPFVRSSEGSFLDSVLKSVDSSRGIYRSESDYSARRGYGGRR